MNARITRFALLAVMSITLLLSACKPQTVITGQRTSVENRVISWVEQTDPHGTANNLP